MTRWLWTGWRCPSPRHVLRVSAETWKWLPWATTGAQRPQVTSENAPRARRPRTSFAPDETRMALPGSWAWGSSLWATESLVSVVSQGPGAWWQLPDPLLSQTRLKRPFDWLHSFGISRSVHTAAGGRVTSRYRSATQCINIGPC